MRRQRAALTLTELLTVVSVIAILISMISPVLIRGAQEARRSACISNLRQIYVAAGIYASGNNGKFPNCFDVDPGSIDANGNGGPRENAWWYSKLWRILSPTDPDLNTASIGPSQCVLRDPASRDPFDQSRASPTCPTVSGTDKDRVFDDCYGWNNAGYCASNPPTNKSLGYGFVYANATPAPAVEPSTYRPPYYATSKFYRTNVPGGYGGYYSGSQAYSPTRTIQGQFMTGNGTECPKCHNFWFSAQAACPIDGTATRAVRFGPIGTWSDVSQASGTILVMDYAKADANPLCTGGGGVDDGSITEFSTPKQTNVTTFVTGYGFRHGGAANALFADGHTRGFGRLGTSRNLTGGAIDVGFLRQVGGPGLHWEVYR